MAKNSRETRFLHRRYGRTNGPIDEQMDGWTKPFIESLVQKLRFSTVFGHSEILHWNKWSTKMFWESFHPSVHPSVSPYICHMIIKETQPGRIVARSGLLNCLIVPFLILFIWSREPTICIKLCNAFVAYIQLYKLISSFCITAIFKFAELPWIRMSGAAVALSLTSIPSFKGMVS